MHVCFFIRRHQIALQRSLASLGPIRSVWVLPPFHPSLFSTWNCQVSTFLQIWYVGHIIHLVVLFCFSPICSTFEHCFKYLFTIQDFSSAHWCFLYFDYFSVGSFAFSNWYVGLFVYSGWKSQFLIICVVNSLFWSVTSLFTLFIVSSDAHKCLNFNVVKSIHLFPTLFVFFPELFKKSFHTLRP